MILLDTNVVSELRQRRQAPDPRVVSWFAAQPEGSAFLSAATVLELERGTLLLERRDEDAGARLRRWLEETVLPRFAGRVLPMDEQVAVACAPLHLSRTRPVVDMIIAATALVHDLTLVTRNVRDFEDTGVRFFNPWMHTV